MLDPQEALSKILARCRVRPVERVALERAQARVLARAVRAERDLPPADRATMDGYAVRAGDVRAVPCELKLIGEVAAGSKARPRVRRGTCVRILTGANLPPGADAVAMVETTAEAAPGLVRFRSKVERGENVLGRGSIAREDGVLLEAGTRLGPPQIAVCAAAGADPVSVFGRARVGVVCTGAELVAAGARATAESQRDSNGPALRAAVEATRLAACVLCGIVGDDAARLKRTLKSALGRCDVLLVVGGVSVGKYDLVPDALKALGCREIFHGVRLKPGKPLLFALGPKNQLVFGLPGNPLSALTGFHEFVAPALRNMAGLRGAGPRRIFVRLEETAANYTGRVWLVPALVSLGADDKAPTATPLEHRGSADVVAAARCDGVIILREERVYRAGELVEFHPWIAG